MPRVAQLLRLGAVKQTVHQPLTLSPELHPGHHLPGWGQALQLGEDLACKSCPGLLAQQGAAPCLCSMLRGRSLAGSLVPGPPGPTKL